MAAPFGPQPNFNLISDEIKKAQNLPAITNGQQILAEIQGVRQELAGVHTDLAGVHQDITAIRQDIAAICQDITATREDITRLDQKLTKVSATSNHNNAARVQNIYVASQSDQLSPFLNPKTGAAIPEFPTTSAELGSMNGQQVDTVLEQLNLQPDQGASVAAKKRMLRAHIGLKEEPA